MNSPRGNPQSRAWRPDDRAAHRRASGAARRMKIAAAVIVLGGVAVGILALLSVIFDRTPTPTLEFAAHTISSYDHYPPNAGAAADEDSLSKLFSDADNGKSSRKNWVLDTAFSDGIDRALYSGETTARKSRQRPAGSSLLVFWSGHAQINPETGVEIEFPAVRYGSSGREDDRPEERPLALSRLLELLSQENAKNIFLFLDMGRLEPDWSLGILARDSASLLQQQVDAALKKNFAQPGRPALTVVASCFAGETSWIVPLGNETSASRPPSAFGFYLAEALKGGCDGFDGGTPDRRITTKELLAYLKKNVADWSKANRGALQTVTILPAERAKDGSVLALLPPTLGNSGPQATADSSSGKTAETQTNPPEPQSKTSADNESKKPSGKSQRPLDLVGLWTRFQDCWNDDAVLGNAPFQLRAFHSNLIRAEQFLDAGLENDSRYERVLRDARDLANALAAIKSENRSRVTTQTTNSELTPSASTVEEAAFLEYFKSLCEAKPTAQKPSSPAPKSSATGAPPQTPPNANKQPPDLRDPFVAARFVDWLLQHPQETSGDTRRQFIKNLRANLPDLGAEWILLSGLYESGNKLGEDNARVWQQAIRLRFRAVALLQQAQSAPELMAILQPMMQQSFAAIRAAETWYFLGKEFTGSANYAERNVSQAESFSSSASDCLKTYQNGLGLRNRLYAELPDLARWMARTQEDPVLGDPVDSETVAALRQWAHSNSQGRWSYQGPKSFSRNASTLLAILADADRLNAALGGLLSADLASSENRCVALKEIVERMNLQELKSLKERSREGDILRVALRGSGDDRQLDYRDWHRLRVAMPLPWTSERRDKLRKLVAAPVSGSSEVPSLHPATAGVWQAFWAIEVLALAGAPPDAVQKVCQSFEQFLNELDALNTDKSQQAGVSPAESIAASRTKLGRQIRQQFDDLAQGTRKSSSTPPSDKGLDERPIRTLDLVQSLSDALEIGNTPDDRILRASRQKFQNDWQRFASRQQERFGEPALPRLDASGAVTAMATETGEHPRRRLDIQPTTMEFDQTSQSANLTIALKDRATDESKFYVLVDYDPSQLRCPSVDNSPIPIQSDKLKLTFTLLDGGARNAGSMRVILLESQPAAKGAAGPAYYLHDVVSIPFTPPTHFSQWSVEFVTADGRQPHQLRHASEGSRGWNEVTLPADGDPLKLIPRIVRPELDRSRSIDVEISCYALDAQGRRTEPPLFEKLKLQLQPNQGPLPLVVSKPPVPDPKSAAAPPAPGVSAADVKKIDLSNGLRFLIQPNAAARSATDVATADDREPAGEYDVQFRWWSPSAYVTNAQLTQVPPTIEIGLQPAGDPPELDKERHEASFLKETFRVKLNFLNDFLKPINGITALDEVRHGGPLALLRVQLDQARIDSQSNGDSRESFALSIDTGPWPHAFRYQSVFDAGQMQFVDASRSLSLRIASPRQYSVFVPNAKGSGTATGPNSTLCKMEVGLPDDLARNQALVLRRQMLEVTSEGSEGRVLQDEVVDDQVTSAWKKSVKVALPLRTEWEFSTSIDDYSSEVKYGDLVGRFLLRAILTDKDRPIRTHDVYFSVDPNPPVVTVRREALLDRYERSKDRFQFNLDISDDESGIKSVSVLLAKHGTKKSSRQPVDGDILLLDRDVNLEPRRDGYPRSWSRVINFPQEKWPASGDYDLYVFADDAAHHETGLDPVRTVTFVPVPAAMANSPTSAPKPGKLAINFTRVGHCELILSEPAKQTKKRDAFDDVVTFERVPPGDYKLNWNGFMGRSGSVDVTIRDGETTTVTVGPN